MKKLLLTCMLALGLGASAQISYNYGFEPAGLGGWTSAGFGSYERSTITPCAGTASVRSNTYNGGTTSITSPALTGTNGGNLTVSFAYKATKYSSNTTGVALADFGSIKVQYASSATGPFTTGFTVNSANHTVAATCATKTATLAGLPLTGNVFLRFEVTAGTAGDNYYYFDDIAITQGAVPTCFVPSAVTAAITSTTAATLSWTAPATAPANGYDIYYSTANTAPTAATVPTTTSATTSKSLTGLTSNTNYYTWVRSNCSAADKSPWVGTTFYTGYCLPSTTSQSTYFSSFTSTGAVTNMAYTSTVGATGGYKDVSSTNKIGNFEGSSTPINISIAGGTAGVAIWVDWNNNFIFDASERVFATTGYVNTTSGSIAVPTGTPVGNYRMRAVTNYNSAFISVSCDALGRGEYIDYTFEVTTPPSCLAPSALTVANSTPSSTDLSWTPPVTAPGLGYDVYYSTSNTAPTAATMPTTSTTASAITLSSLTQSTLYYVWVRSKCSATDLSSWAALPSFTTGTPPIINDNCSAPTAITPGATFAQNAINTTNAGATNTTDVTAVHPCQASTNKDVWFSVVVPASGKITLETKSIPGSDFIDSVVSAYSGSCGALTSVGCNDDDGDGNMSLLSLTNQIPGSTLLIAVYNYSATTTGLFQISAYDGSLATGETIVKDDKSFTIAPNPFSDVVRISDVKDVVSISVVDLSGRIVKTVKPAREIQLGDLKSGMYLINLTMKDGSVKTVKAIKK